MAGVTVEEQAQIAGVLGVLPGLSEGDVRAAIDKYGTRAIDGGAALLAVAGGAPVNLRTLGPVIGIGLAATGVGAPVAAAVTAGLEVLDSLSSFFAGDDRYAWKVGGVGVNAIRPSGPNAKSGPRWRSFDDWIGAGKLSTFHGYDLHPSAADAQADASFYFFRHGILDDEIALGMRDSHAGRLTPAASASGFDGFRRAFLAAWEANAEYEINGYARVPDAQLLRAAVEAWNAVHSASSSYALDPSGSTFVEQLAAGKVDGTALADKNGDPLRVNTGPQAKVVRGLRMRRTMPKLVRGLHAHWTGPTTPQRRVLRAVGLASLVLSAAGAATWWATRR